MSLTLFYTIVGFALAGWSVIANDSIQTLGTYMASKMKWFKWYTLAGVASIAMIITITYGWYVYDGDISYGRLTQIPYQEVYWYHAVAPLILLYLVCLEVSRCGFFINSIFIEIFSFFI